MCNSSAFKYVLFIVYLISDYVNFIYLSVFYFTLQVENTVGYKMLERKIQLHISYVNLTYKCIYLYFLQCQSRRLHIMDRVFESADYFLCAHRVLYLTQKMVEKISFRECIINSNIILFSFENRRFL